MIPTPWRQVVPVDDTSVDSRRTLLTNIKRGESVAQGMYLELRLRQRPQMASIFLIRSEVEDASGVTPAIGNV